MPARLPRQSRGRYEYWDDSRQRRPVPRAGIGQVYAGRAPHFGRVIQSLLEIVIGVGLAVLAVHRNSKFYAYLRCGRCGDLHKPQLPALHLHCPSALERYAGD
jgi:hypothetical protein